jgi:hypothetical protein
MFFCLYFFIWENSPKWARAFSFTRFLGHTQDTPQSVRILWTSDQLVAEASYRTAHNALNRQMSMPPVGFELTILARERPQTHALDRTATGTGVIKFTLYVFICKEFLMIYFSGRTFYQLTGRGKFHHRRCREGSQGEWRYSSTLSLTWALDGGG